MIHSSYICCVLPLVELCYLNAPLQEDDDDEYGDEGESEGKDWDELEEEARK